MINNSTKKQVISIYGSDKFLNEDGTFEYETSPLKAIHKKCLYDCCAGDLKSLKECNCTYCFLHPFRFGNNPYRKPREISEETLEKLRGCLEKARANNSKFNS